MGITWMSSGSGSSSGASNTIGVTAKTDNYTVLTGDMEIDKALSMTNAATKTFTLPSVAAGNIGISCTFLKLGAGKLIIDASDSDTIHDSTAGGTIYNDLSGETYATITLMLTGATQWSVVNYSGLGWVTT